MKRISTLTAMAGAILLTLSLTACDDNDDGDGGANVETVPVTEYCKAAENWNTDNAAKEQALIDLVNAQRAKGATCGNKGSFSASAPLTRHTGLDCAARVHTKDMADRDFFDHTNPDGQGPGERMKAAGVESFGWGENIAAGNGEAQGTFDQWMSSDGHCANFMNPNFTHIGMGYYEGGDWNHLWTATLMTGRE
ncbi:MAG: CAP domain-containing protein [Deltaproteobacteria bacterium]|nr:CAP domain-containing protein [Deltaproteobacteria bacterium]